MTQRVKDLLDEAISEVTPRDPDPVAGVIARGRAARRRRSVGAAVLAVAVVIGGGFAVRAQVSADVLPPPVVAETGPPPTPKLVGGNVVAGDVVLPVPPGWRVVPAGTAGKCGALAGTVLLAGPGRAGCGDKQIEVRGTREMFSVGVPEYQPGSGPPTIVPSALFGAPTTYTLPGGEPAWLGVGVDDPLRPTGKPIYNLLVLPWSKVAITMWVPLSDQQWIIDSIRPAPPGPATRLVLPGTVAGAQLAMPTVAFRYDRASYGESTDRATIAAVLKLLRKQTSVVDQRHACASAGQRAATLILKPPVKPGAPAATSAPGAITVVISLGGDCQEAVSSAGGRVRLSDATVRELARLFRVTVR